MIRHLFLDKTNTIVESSKQNLGLNPVLGVGYGNVIMRGLIHFDECMIREMIEDKTIADINKLKCTLKMTNYFSIDGIPHEQLLINSFAVPAKRAASFDLILFKLPCDFDEGRGFDFISDFWIRNNTSISTEGSNWYFSKNGIPWTYEVNDKPAAELVMPSIFNKNEFIQIYKKLLDYSKKLNEVIVPKDSPSDEPMDAEDCFNAQLTEQFIENTPETSYVSDVTCEEIIEDIKNIKTNVKLDEKALKGGVYSFSTILTEYQKYLDGKDSIVVASQHFDFGDETLSMDITDYVLECVKTGVNHGLCLAFAPNFENRERDFEQYVGFVDDNTNTFFHPYVEVDYQNYINDDRESFTLGRKNKLFLYTFDDGEPVNLDKIPTCEVEGTLADVKQVSKGVYCAEIDTNGMNLEPAAIYYDKWSEIALNDRPVDDVELEFSTRPASRKFKVGSDSSVKNTMVPSIYGIDDFENLHQGEVREVTVDFRKEYETEKKYLIDSAEYRLYVKDGNREVTVIDYQPVEKAFLNNFFIVYTEDLIPNTYYIDIKVKMGRETRYFKQAIRFKVVSDVTERYQ